MITNAKMTDKEIFANEILCIRRRSSGSCNGGEDCNTCDLIMDEKEIISAYERAMKNIDLINRQKEQIEGLQDEVVIKTDMLNNQKAEIENLKKFCNDFSETLSNNTKKADLEKWEAVDKAKSEAYREYEGRVRMILEKRYGKAYMRESKTIADLVNLTKELTEKNDFKEESNP